MKKWIPVLLCLMLVVLLALPATAEGTTQFTITPSKTTAHRGDEITFTVSVSNSNLVKSMGLILNYNQSVYELVGGSCTAQNAAMKEFDNSGTGAFAVLFSEANAFSGSLGTFTLKVKADAPFAAAAVSGEPSAKSGDTVFASAVTAANVTVACNHQYDNDCDDTCNVCGGTRTVQHAWVVKSETPAPDCNTPGSVTYECSKCHITKSENTQPGHKYEDAKDANGHYQKCSVCGAETTHEAHTYSTEWKHDDKGHWQICTECEYEDKDHKAAHTPGAEATEFTDQVCTTCKRVLKGATHQCTEFEEEWFRDDRGHRHKCTECGKYSEFEKHDYENECDADCSICGYTRIPEHLYTEKWSADVNGHWHACELCGEGLEIEPHVPGPEATLTTPQICLVCNYEIAPSLGHTHKYDGQWKHDTDGHWKVCSCGKESDEEAHRWDAGVVTREPTSAVVGRKTFTCQDCGYQKTESIDTVPSGNGPIPDNTPKKPGFPWWLIIILVAIPVVAGCAYVLVGVVGSKKQEGRFTEQ